MGTPRPARSNGCAYSLESFFCDVTKMNNNGNSEYMWRESQTAKDVDLTNKSIFDYVLGGAPRPGQVDVDFVAQNVNLNREARWGAPGGDRITSEMTHGRNKRDYDFSTVDTMIPGVASSDVKIDGSRIAFDSHTSKKEGKSIGAETPYAYTTPLLPSMKTFLQNDVPRTHAIGVPSRF
jgi:hypothetical protein